MKELILITKLDSCELLKINVNNLFDVEELIADSMTGLMIRAEKLNDQDQLAISEEFREWLNDGVRIEDVLKLVTIKNNQKLV